VADIVPASAYGRACGFERMMDNLGAFFGPLLALGLLAALGVQWAIDLSVIPGLLAAVGPAPRLAVHSRLAVPPALPCWRVGATSWAVIRSARAQPSPPQSDSDVIAFRARREGPAVGVGRVSR
jgi:MFS family permease